MPTQKASEKTASSVPPIDSSRRRARHRLRPAAKPTTAPAGRYFTPSQGSRPSSANSTNVSRREMRSLWRRVSSRAPARQTPATSSGSTEVACTSTGGDRPTATVAPIAHGSGTTRNASRYARHSASAAIAAMNKEAPVAPPTAKAGAIRIGRPTPVGSSSWPSRRLPIARTGADWKSR